MMNSILITGGAGFIGSHFVRRCVADKSAWQVITLDKLSYSGSLNNLADILNHSRHTFIQGDIGDGNLVQNILDTHKPTWVVNFSAESHVDRSISDPTIFLQNNIVAVVNLLQECLGYWKRTGCPDDFRFLQISTDEVFGSLSSEDMPTPENASYRPNSPYSASKAAADHWVRAYGHTYGLPCLITHSSNNYGSHQFPEKLIPVVILRALQGKPIPIYGDGQNVRDWLHVTDHCEGILRVLTSGHVGSSYNLGANQEKTNLELVRLICRYLDELAPKADGSSYSELITFVPNRLGHDFRYALDCSKVRMECGWEPKKDFEASLREVVVWYKANFYNSSVSSRATCLSE